MRATPPAWLSASDLDRAERSPVRCIDPDAEAAMIAEIEAAKRDRDTLGGVTEVRAFGVPPGLGSYVEGGARLDGRIAAAMLSIQSAKGVEIGDAIASSGRGAARACTTRSSTRTRRAGTARRTGPEASKAG